MLEIGTSEFDFDRALDLIEPVPSGSDSSISAPEYSDFPAEEFSQRYRRLQTLMAASGFDAILATQEENVRYFSGYLTVLWVSKFRPLVAILPAESDVPPGLLVPGQERGNAELTSWIGDVFAYPPALAPIDHLVAELQKRDLHKGRLGIELGFGQRLGMNQMQFQSLLAALPDATFADATPLMEAVRMLKSELEIERIARACEITCAGVEAGWRNLREGMSERELAAVMAAAMFQSGAEVGTKPSLFGTLAGERWRLANAVPSDYQVRRGDLILVDGGASFRGYVCDLIRQASLGPPTQAQREWFGITVDANNAAIQSIAPGVLAHQVYDAAMERLAARGVTEENWLSIVGHGIGADIHELPWLGERDIVYSAGTRIRESMVLCVEPRIVAPDALGVPGHFIVEDVVVVEASGARVLTKQLSKELWVAD